MVPAGKSQALPAGIAHGISLGHAGGAAGRAGLRSRRAADRGGLDLRKFGVQASHGVFPPGARAEPVMGDRGQHEEAGLGRVEAGLQILDDQLVEIERTAHHAFDVELHRMRGELLQRNGHGTKAAAEAAFIRAIDIARQQQTRTFELRATFSLAQLYHSTGRHQAARDLLIPALRSFNDPVEVPEVFRAQRLLSIESS